MALSVNYELQHAHSDSTISSNVNACDSWKVTPPRHKVRSQNSNLWLLVPPCTWPSSYAVYNAWKANSDFVLCTLPTFHKPAGTWYERGTWEVEQTMLIASFNRSIDNLLPATKRELQGRQQSVGRSGLLWEAVQSMRVDWGLTMKETVR